MADGSDDPPDGDVDSGGDRGRDPTYNYPGNLPAADRTVLDRYPDWPAKGPVVDGRRIAIATANSTCGVDEAVRVLHAFEATEPGVEVYVVGPKEVYGERVDGDPATPPPPFEDDPWIPAVYDGQVVEGPAVDFHYEVTTYRFSEPGPHRIRWVLGPLESGELVVQVER